MTTSMNFFADSCRCSPKRLLKKTCSSGSRILKAVFFNQGSKSKAFTVGQGITISAMSSSEGCLTSVWFTVAATGNMQELLTRPRKLNWTWLAGNWDFNPVNGCSTSAAAGVALPLMLARAVWCATVVGITVSVRAGSACTGILYRTSC